MKEVGKHFCTILKYCMFPNLILTQDISLLPHQIILFHPGERKNQHVMRNT
jgi:hypothetical protein